MPPLWAITSRLWSGVPAQTLCRQTYASTTRALPQRYSTVSPEVNPELNSRAFADPERPDLFYHLFKAPSDVSATNHVFGLSFLETLKSKGDARSPLIIGYLPASEDGHAVKAGLNDFRENRKSANYLFWACIVDDLVWQLGSGRFYTKRYAKGWRKAWTMFKPTEHANFRKGGCTSTVRLFPTRREMTSEVFTLMRFYR